MREEELWIAKIWCFHKNNHRNVLKKILFFALYQLGARLNAMASLVEMPEESGKTIISRVMKE